MRFYIPTEAVSCKNVHYSDENHIDAINKLYSDIVNLLIQPGEQIMQNDKKKYTHKPGWAEYVDNLYDHLVTLSRKVASDFW